MGSFTGIGKLPSELSEKTSLSETDIVITGSAAQRTTWKNVLEKISFSGLATTAKNIIGAINELNTNRLKVKTKAYRIEVAFDSNIGKYEGHIVNTDFLKDFPAGTIVATLVTGHDMHGYGLHNATWSIFDNNLIANATMAGTYNATVTWLYL